MGGCRSEVRPGMFRSLREHRLGGTRSRPAECTSARPGDVRPSVPTTWGSPGGQHVPVPVLKVTRGPEIICRRGAAPPGPSGS